MALSANDLRLALDALGQIEPRIAAGLARVGYPKPRTSIPGYETLLRTIVGQQVSVAAARSIWGKLETIVGGGLAPDALIGASDEALRSAGLSRQKASYAKSLAEKVASGALDLHSLPLDDEEAIAALSSVKGIGRWSAEIYLLFERTSRYLAGGRPGGADRTGAHSRNARAPRRKNRARCR